MSDSTAGGSIYDLGYQHYSGARLGRRHAIVSLYVHTLRGIFGIGRPLSSKVAPIGLLVISLLPAVLQLGITALFSEEAEVLRPEEYYGFIIFVLAIFMAVVAPETAGRDQRSHTLSLYFSRALQRTDYALAKFTALVTSMLCLTFVPQVLAFFGSAAAVEDFGAYVENNWDDIPASLVSALLLSGLLSSIGLAIAAQTPRRAYSTVGIIAALVLTSTIGIALFETIDGDARRYALLISPISLAEGLTYWIFGATPAVDEPVGEADLWGGLYTLVNVAASFLLLAIIVRRYGTIQA